MIYWATEIFWWADQYVFILSHGSFYWADQYCKGLGVLDHRELCWVDQYFQNTMKYCAKKIFFFSGERFNRCLCWAIQISIGLISIVDQKNIESQNWSICVNKPRSSSINIEPQMISGGLVNIDCWAGLCVFYFSWKEREIDLLWDKLGATCPKNIFTWDGIHISFFLKNVCTPTFFLDANTVVFFLLSHRKFMFNWSICVHFEICNIDQILSPDNLW